MNNPSPSVGIPPSDPTAAEGLAKRWHVGTLSYSTNGLVRVFVWLLGGDFGLSMKDRAVAPIAMVMLRTMSTPVWIVGLLVGSIPSAMGLFLGPVISVKSDRYRSRWGRRIPFILIPAPFVFLSMLGLAFAPNMGVAMSHWLGSRTSTFACQIAVFALCWTIYEMMATIAAALVGALVNDVVPQAVIGRFFGLFRVVSLVAGIIFNQWLMGQSERHFRALLVTMGLIYGIGVTLMCLMVKEGQYPPPEARAQGSFNDRFIVPVVKYLRECYGNPYFLWFFLATTIGSVAIVPVNAFSIYQATSVGMSDQMFGHCQAISYAWSVLLAYPLGVLADRFHPLRLAIAILLAYLATTVFGFFFASTASAFYVALLLHTVISGCYWTGTASIAQRLLPREKFAEISSAGGIIAGIINMILPPVLGGFIALMHHEYRYVFLLAAALSAIGAGCFVVLLKKYLELGGENAKANLAPSLHIPPAFEIIPDDPEPKL
jgi:MFS family permease